MSDNFPKQRLDDIAAAAHVSLATVSRVLNNKGNVSVKTRTQVLKAMRDIGYRVRTTNVIGLILPDCLNPFFSQLGFLFEQALEAQDWHVLISSSEGRPDRELQLIERFKGFGVRGLIYIASGQISNTLYSLIADGELPVVVLDRQVAPMNFDFVAV